MKLTSKDKIKLDITDDLVFELIARLVDNDDFVVEIKRLRERLDLNLMPYEEAKDWLKSNKGAIRSKMGLQLSSIKQKFVIGDNLDSALRISLLANCITDAEITPVFCAIYPFSEDEEPEFDTPVVAIFVNAETKKEDVLHLMENDVKALLKEIHDNKILPNKANWSTRKVREWYWLHKDMTYNQVYNKLIKDLGDSAPEYETVKQAVYRYRKKLSTRRH